MLLRDRSTLTYASPVVLFHFANAALLPLGGQYLATGADRGASLYMSACIVTAQIGMIPMAAFSGRCAERRGRKPIFLIAFLFLPIRGILFALDNSPRQVGLGRSTGFEQNEPGNFMNPHDADMIT